MWNPGKQIWSYHKNVKVDPMSSLVHFWAKSFKTFHEILCSRILPCLILPWNRSRSTEDLHLNYLVSTRVPDASCQVSQPFVNWFWRRRVLKAFIIYGRGGHIGHVTWTIQTYFCFCQPWGLHMKYEYNWLIGFWGNVWNCKLMVVLGSKVKQWPWPFLPQIFIYLLRQL